MGQPAPSPPPCPTAVTVVDVDKLASDSAEPDRAWLQQLETSPLLQVRALLVKGAKDDLNELLRKANSPRLWKVVADSALDALDLDLADRAFVQCKNWHGVQLVKKLRTLGEGWKQRVEVLTFLERFDEAEQLLVEVDRVDLALDLRVRLGDWFHAARFLDNGYGDDALRARAYDGLGDYYGQRGQWRQAVRYYVLAKNSEKALECFQRLEDFRGMENLVDALHEGHPSLVGEYGRGGQVGRLRREARPVAAASSGDDPHGCHLPPPRSAGRHAGELRGL